MRPSRFRRAASPNGSHARQPGNVARNLSDCRRLRLRPEGFTQRASSKLERHVFDLSAAYVQHRTLELPLQLDALQNLALSVAQARSPDSVLKEMVSGLGMTEGVALARVWLLEEDNNEPHLRLRASIGLSLMEPGVRWTHTDGAHQKLPLSYGKVGKIAAEGAPLLLHRGPSDWLLQPDWAEREQIESFAGQPLVFRGEVLGVVAVFSRKRINKQELDWLRTFADHAAVAIANARAYEEIARLKESLERERDYLRQEVQESLHHGDLVLQSAAMQTLMQDLRAVATADTNVLILGESGVGKELMASAIHEHSRRAQGPLVKVNCASIPAELFESEFFGHVRGAFSGASRDREGRFQLAHGGTLFLDEVGEIPLGLQGKLLRVLEAREFERVGDDRTRKVDVRVIAATNRDLKTEVERGRFRSDLYYRLGVVPIEVPALRERKDDILPLTERFLARISRQLNLEAPPLTEVDRANLLGYDFPGNIRELRNIIERAVVMYPSSKKPISFHIPATADAGVTNVALVDASELGAPVVPMEQLKQLMRSNVENALRLSGGKVAGEGGAAELLGVKPSTLTYQIKALGIDKPR